LVEGKSPGDKLQKNQGRWMHYFSQHNIPHRVLHVKYSDEIESDEEKGDAAMSGDASV